MTTHKTQLRRAYAMLRMIHGGTMKSGAAMSATDMFHDLGNLIDDAEDPQTADGSLTEHHIRLLKHVLVSFRDAVRAIESCALSVRSTLDQLETAGAHWPQ